MAIVTLVEAQPWDPATGAVVPVRLAGGGRRHYRHKGFADWRAGVVSPPRLVELLDFDGGFSGGAVPSASAIGFSPARADTRAAIARLMWVGAPVTVSIGDDEAAVPDWTVELAGTVAGYTVPGGTFIFTIANLAGRLDQPLVTATFAGTGGIEGSAAATGRLKRRSWGRCWNVEARLLDPAFNIHEVGDPSRPLAGIDQVKDKGRAGPLVLVGWAGSIDATLAALKAAQAPAGGAAVAPSIACVKWWTQATLLTVDLRGEVGDGYVETVAGIAAAISAAAGGPAVIDLAAAIAARPDPAGLHVEDAGERGVAALDRLLIRASMGWSLVAAGGLSIAPIGFADPVATIVGGVAEREAGFAPVTAVQVDWRRNHRLLAAGDISAAVLAGDVTFADGTTVADWAGEIRQDVDDAVRAAVIASSDGWLTPTEKRGAVIDFSDLSTQQGALFDQYVTLGRPAEVAGVATAAHDRLAELAGYLDDLVPDWNDYSQPTALADPALYQSKWTAAGAAINSFAAAITGRPGRDALTADLTNQGHIVPALHDGTVTSYAGAESVFFVRSGSVDLTDSGQFDLSVVGNPQGLTVAVIGRYFRVEGGMDAGEDSATVTVRLTGSGAFAGVVIDKIFSLAKVRGGADGSPAPQWSLGAVPQLVRFDTTGAIIPGQSVRFTFVGTNIAPGTATVWRLSNVDGSPLIQANSAADFVQQAGPAYWQSPDPDTVVCTEAGVAQVFADHGGAVGRWSLGAVPFGRGEFDTVAILKVRDGAKGDRGDAAPLVRSQWSVNGSDGWHDYFFGADVFKRESNDGGVNYGPPYRAIGEAGNVGADGTSPSSVFLRSATVPGTPGAGNPPPGWSDGPPAGTDFLWESKSLFRGATQLKPWSTPIRITGEPGPPGTTPITLDLSAQSVTVYATYSSVTKAEQLPLYVQVSVRQGNADLTDAATIAVTPSTDAIAASYASRNVAIAKADSIGSITVSGSCAGVTLPERKIQIVRQLDAAPPASSTSVSRAVSLVVTGRTYSNAQTTGSVVLAAGATGTVYVSAGGSYRVDRGDPRGAVLGGKLVYRASGGTVWNDMSGEATGTFANGDEYEYEPGDISIDNGSITGLTPDAVYEFAFSLRIASTGTNVGFTGSVVASQSSLAYA